MSSKRKVRRKQCVGKIRHASADAAHAANRHTRGRFGVMRPYHCTFCGGWHVGHFFDRATITNNKDRRHR
jgi:hypothetical protein